MTNNQIKQINELIEYGTRNIDWKDYIKSKNCFGLKSLKFAKEIECRTIDYSDVFEVDEVNKEVCEFVKSLSTAEALKLAAASGINLWAVITERLGLTTETIDLCVLLRTTFPPNYTIPTIKNNRFEDLIGFAMGEPGDTVPHGLFPSRITKVSRLLLAKSSYYDKKQVINAAKSAYNSGQPYHAHDAVYCAVVHPKINAEPIVTNYIHENTRGWKSRRKSWEIYRWAIKYGYIDAKL